MSQEKCHVRPRRFLPGNVRNIITGSHLCLLIEEQISSQNATEWYETMYSKEQLSRTFLEENH